MTVTRTTIVIAAVLAARAAGAGAAEPSARFFHTPPAEAAEGQPLVIEAKIDRSWQTAVEIHYRTIGDAAWKALEFQRGTAVDDWRATVPADAVRPPGVEYYIASADTAHFASERDPHQVMVFEDAGKLEREEELARVNGRRARVHTAYEIVDFGKRTTTGMRGETIERADYFYRVDVDFTYRLLRFPLYSLRFGATRLLGRTGGVESGFKEAGWVEIRLRLTSLLEIDGRGIVALTGTGVSLGGRGEVRVGSDLRSHVAFGLEGVAETGSSFFLRLGWDTVPRFPMSTTVEITDFPSPTRPHGVRLVYDVAYPMANGVRPGARLGYQARDPAVGGVALGLNASLDF